jgi:hypothetical protein
LRNPRKTGRVGGAARLEVFLSWLATPTAPFALLRKRGSFSWQKYGLYVCEKLRIVPDAAPMLV